MRYSSPVNQRLASLTIGEVLLRYYEQHGKNVAAHVSIKAIVSLLTAYYGNMSADEATSPTQIEKLVAAFQARKYSKGYIANIITVIKSAMNRAWKRGEVDKQVYIAVPAAGEVKPKGRPLSVQEAALWYSHAAPHMQALILLCLGTASRPEAIKQLTWSQVDFQEGLIHLNPPDRTQTKKRRPVVRMSPTIQAYLKDMPRNGKYVINYHGKEVKRYYTALVQARIRAGLDDKVNLYSCRHTAARWMRKHGVPPWEVAAQLGHTMAGYSTTEIYAAYAPDYQAKATAALDGLVLQVLDTSKKLASNPMLPAAT